MAVDIEITAPHPPELVFDLASLAAIAGVWIAIAVLSDHTSDATVSVLSSVSEISTAVLALAASVNVVAYSLLRVAAER